MAEERLTIKKWSEDDRPREKLIEKGPAALSNAELIAILIGSGNRHETAVDVAKKLLNLAENNINTLGKKSLSELTRLNGIGPAKAINIIAALELGKRRKLSEILVKEKITSSSDVFNIMQYIIGDLPHEEFWILLTSRSNKLLEKIKISQGGISGTVVDIRLILRPAIEKQASGIILCHNHPSGNKQASEHDKAVTAKLAAACKVMDIQLLDHVIVANNTFLSFADEGMMP